MKTLPVALQVFSVRDDAEKDFKGTMQKVKEMGYDGVELAGLYGHTAAQIRQMLDEVGIRAISAHIPYVELIADMEGIVDQYMAIGCEYIVIPYLNDEYRPGVENFGQVLESIAKLGSVCRRKGVTLLYHNHDFEFITMEDGLLWPGLYVFPHFAGVFADGAGLLLGEGRGAGSGRLCQKVCRALSRCPSEGLPGREIGTYV